MASRRILKKCINNLTFDLISECYVYSFFHKDAKSEKTNGVMEELLKLRNEMVDKINHPAQKEDRKENRKYYRAIITDMQNMVNIMDKLGEN
jgi:hypothetical protein